MTAELALGTYRCRTIPEAAVCAAASGAQWVDTARTANDCAAALLRPHTNVSWYGPRPPT
ncbi:hypothetical protein GCM10017687_07890 [Streptomyces echinatus]|uniref:Uncharacterized protein n=1 Tax=Streptomyces echinatus TaxID=67293 RepID=A0A7W9Q1G4_9ACTN|nr:hypothetical protein [Streptomyces echinatus]